MEQRAISSTPITTVLVDGKVIVVSASVVYEYQVPIRGDFQEKRLFLELP
jgi:hypothetical protein